MVQDPDSARFSSMPASAILGDDVDHVADPLEIGRLIRTFAELGGGPVGRHVPDPDVQVGQTDVPDGSPSPFTCPRCHGPLWQRETDVVHYRCRVGHSWGDGSLEAEQMPSA